MIMAAKMAIPKPSITNDEPMKAAVNWSVIALITNKKNPKVKIVTGSVRITRIGRTIKFKIERMILAKNAAPKPAI